MDPNYPHCLASEADELLETTLTEDDQEKLREVYRNVSGEIHWGQAIDNVFPILLEMAEELVQSDGMCKNDSSWYMVPEEDHRLFEDGDLKAMARRHSLILMLAKKLLGGLKTRVNQSTKDIRVLSLDEEDELVTIAWSNVDQGPEEGEPVARTEVVAEVEIAPGGTCRGNGRHARTTTRFKRKNEEMVRETYCKDCRQVIETIEGSRPLQSPKVCQHPGAKWIEGQEGREAKCGDCDDPIGNPETYQWVSSGLEPYGDDPNQDEAITLCSDY